MNILEEFETLIPSDAWTYGVRLHIPSNYDLSSNYGNPLVVIQNYFLEHSDEVIAMTAGMHCNGTNSIPHFHLHVITRNMIDEKSNPSQFRNRYFAKNNVKFSTGTLSIKVQQIQHDAPKWQFLAYPLKEANPINNVNMYLWRGCRMREEMKEFLLQAGNQIYTQQLAMHQRRDASNERKQNALLELYEIASKVKHENFEAMIYYLQKNYIENCELQELPDQRNYKSNVNKVGQMLKLINSYYHL